MTTFKIDKTEYELEQHDNGKILSDIKIPKGWRLLMPWEAQRLWDMNLLRDNWILVENTHKELKKKYVARFSALSAGTSLSCVGYPSSRGSSLGVIFARDLK